MNSIGSEKKQENLPNTENIRLADAALSSALNEFGLYHSHWICRYDLEKNEVFYFFPLDRINKLGEKKSDFIEIIKKHWINSGFEIIRSSEISPDISDQVSFNSLFFCLKAKSAMKKNLCLDKTKYTELAAQAILPVLKNPYFKTGSWTYGVDTDNGDILVFFSRRRIEEMNYGKYHFFVSAKKAWLNAGFKVVEQTELPKYEYSRVGFNSVCFRLRRIFIDSP